MLERRRRSEVAPTSVMATCGVLGVSTRRLETLALRTWDHHTLQVPALREMAHRLDAEVKACRTRPLDTGP